MRHVLPALDPQSPETVAAGAAAWRTLEAVLGLSDDEAGATPPLVVHGVGNAGLRAYAKVLERARRLGRGGDVVAAVLEAAPSFEESSTADLARRLDDCLDLDDPHPTLNRFDGFSTCAVINRWGSFRTHAILPHRQRALRASPCSTSPP